MSDASAGLHDSRLRYVIRESLISSVINMLIGLAIFAFLSRHEQSFTFGGTSRFTLDFLPQAFFLGLFSALPPALLTRKRMAAGAIAALPGSPPFGLSSILLRSVILALCSLVVFGGVSLLIAAMVPPQALEYSSALMVKAGFAIAVSWAITPVAVVAALRTRLNTSTALHPERLRYNFTGKAQPQEGEPYDP